MLETILGVGWLLLMVMVFLGIGGSAIYNVLFDMDRGKRCAGKGRQKGVRYVRTTLRAGRNRKRGL